MNSLTSLATGFLTSPLKLCLSLCFPSLPVCPLVIARSFA